MLAEVAPTAALAAFGLFIVTGLRVIPTGPRLALDGVIFLAASLILLWRAPSADAAMLAIWLKGLTVAWWLFGARLLSAALDFLLHVRRGDRESRLGSDLLAATIYAAALAVVLSSVFGLSITGVLATSGVVAIVLGLALQSTLSDVFAGVAVGVDAPFRIGDRVRVGDLTEGVVTGANWRSVRIHTDSDDEATIPNSLVAKGMIYNYSFPTRRRAVSAELSAPAAYPPERVIAVCLEAAALSPDILALPAAGGVVARLGAARNLYHLNYYVGDSAGVASSKDALLRAVRRQLHFAGLLEPPPGAEPPSPPSLRLRLLRSLEVFESLSADQLAHLVEHARISTCEPGDRLFEEGAQDATLYAIASGAFEVTRAGDSYGRLGAGEYVGEASLINGSPHAATLIALTAASAIAVTRDDLAPYLAGNTALASALEQSARRGLKRIERKAAVGVVADDDFRGRLIAYVQAMIHLPHRHAGA